MTNAVNESQLMKALENADRSQVAIQSVADTLAYMMANRANDPDSDWVNDHVKEGLVEAMRQLSMHADSCLNTIRIAALSGNSASTV